ncbi:chromate transporter [Urinicoccus massiliensis]|uniref:chromate transporter n=1 Tax=Urinicoccus massiliensis TaxID=1723382 RepID=UPI0009303210|nr:chromate transporter [Urinicoccus massiliensis]
MKKLAHLFFIFFKIGAFTIGGGYAMLPIIQDQVVNKYHWMSDEEFLNSIALTNSIPGPLATNTATFVGYHILGFRGALAAMLGAISPSILIILVIASAFEHFSDSVIAQAVFEGIRPAVVALILYSVFKLGKSVKLREKCNWLLMVLAFAGISFFHVHPIFIILAGALFGIFLREKL